MSEPKSEAVQLRTEAFSARRLTASLLRLPVWVQATAVYAVSRVVTLLLFSIVLRFQAPTFWSDNKPPTFFEFLGFWDADWYRRIADEGYPRVLPLTDSGDVAQNQWAFYPLHPTIVGWLRDMTGIDYKVLSPIVSHIFALAAAIAILYLFRRHADPARALAGTALVFFFPAAAVFSTGYSEAAGIFFLALSLLCVDSRRYLLAIPAVLLMDLARPIGVAFSFFMLIHLLDRIRRRQTEPYPLWEVLTSWALGVLSCFFAVLQPLGAWMLTGQFDAYRKTEAAWTGHTEVFTQWLTASTRYLGWWGPIALAVLILLFVWGTLGPTGELIGRTQKQFLFGYAVYLLLFFTPQTSTLRLLLPMFGLAMVQARSRSRTALATALIGFTVLQLLWVSLLWRLVPPTGFPP